MGFYCIYKETFISNKYIANCNIKSYLYLPLIKNMDTVTPNIFFIHSISISGA